VSFPANREQLRLALREPLPRIGLRILARLMEWLSDLQPKQLNYSQVTPQLAVGGAYKPRQIRLLKAHGVTSVVDCRSEALDDQAALAAAGLSFLHLPTPDRHGFTYEQLHSGVDWVLDRVAEGGKAFLHCEHGVGRGPLMTMAVLVAQGHPAPEALRIVRAARWQAMPNDRQLQALLDFEKEWRANRPSGKPQTR
jgi:polymorphic toxin system DSP-PTPase phosphatase-like protein